MKSKSAIITGSTSGIGLSIAKKLAESGYNIMLNGFGEKDKISSIINNLKNNFKVKIEYSSADISNYQEVESLVELTQKQFGSLEVIVNNAGIQHVESTENFPIEKWQNILSINLSGAFYLIKFSLPLMKKQNFGRIINLASVHGLVGSVQKSAYVASKHGIIGLTKVVALENAQFNITCNAVCPGWVYTPLVEKQIIERSKNENISIEEATKNLLFEKQPSMKFVELEELANLIKFLASEEAKSITGVSIPVDGGWVAR